MPFTITVFGFLENSFHGSYVWWTWAVVFVLSLVLGFVHFVHFFNSIADSRRSPKLPIALGDEIPSKKERIQRYSTDTRNLLINGYTKFKDQVFGIDTTEEYTKLGNLTEEQIYVVNKELNPSLLIHQLVQDFWPVDDFESFTPVKAYPKINRLVSRVCARFFQGTDAAHDERWLDVAADYIHSAIVWTGNLKKWPRYLRPLVWRFVSGRHNMMNQFEIGKYIAMSTTVMQCLIDVSVYNQYVPELREEISRVLEASGGVVTKQSLQQMFKLDSFIKETQRLNAPDLMSFQRKVQAPLTLSNGVLIPKGARLMLPTGAINMDAQIFEGPEHFDGLRFYKKRLESEESRNKYQLVTVGKTDLAWGYGRHACPGRFIADVTIKLIMIEFLMKYDMKRPESGARPKNIEFEGVLTPDPDWELLFKCRSC
ncbi:cytochrome P450 [Zopfia rhizophila CBS 207.26]|uniref:Cytochrome P450 n=1 Tax=Zopfia rhizophila CBS 207.26 TaxID=1314779 RepID=A0A6A6E753_9PEZI|nr:cytochrome P450 [Zopfia rhizophila CBS 207.26]